MISDMTGPGGREVVSQRRRATAGGSSGSDNAGALGAADVVCLAAAPTFAIMALATGVLGGSQTDMLCSTMHGASPLSGMALMYLLMGSFHTAPWLKLIYGRRSSAKRYYSGVRRIER